VERLISIGLLYNFCRGQQEQRSGVKTSAASFMGSIPGSVVTFISTPTNLMIYGPGGYRIADFLKAGLPLKLICAVIAIPGLSLFPICCDCL